MATKITDTHLAAMHYIASLSLDQDKSPGRRLHLLWRIADAAIQLCEPADIKAIIPEIDSATK